MNSNSKEIQLQYEGFSNTKHLWIKPLENTTQFIDYQYNYTKPFKHTKYTNLRLGKLVEQFVFYELSLNNNIEIILENIQIQDEKITIGELDCILIENDTPVHLEIIYKFYLYDNTVGNTETEHWIGPNRRDSFHKKLKKLTDKQLPLLFNPKTKELLAKHNLKIENIVQKVYFKAQLFPHINDFNKEFPLINNDCISGFYIYKNELIKYTDCKFYIPRKHNWLVTPHTNINWLNFDDFNNQLMKFLSEESAPLCWMKKENGQLYKFFVVWW